MTNKQKEQLLRERQLALATIVLTRRKAATVREAPRGAPFDLLTYVDDADSTASGALGIVLRGSFTIEPKAHLNKQLASIAASLLDRSPSTIPICLFFFSMRDDVGYFSWLIEPTVDKAGTPRLRYHKKPESLLLSPKLWNQALSQTEDWYQTLETKLVAS